MSVCRRHIKQARRAPQSPNDKKNIPIFKQKHLFTTYKPYPPSFRRIPARIIEPANGASTWALGNHKCTEYIGNLTKKAPYKKTRNLLSTPLLMVLITAISNVDAL